MNTPTVSVLVPCCNDGLYLNDTLSSIASQTWHDFEVIISDEAVDPLCLKISQKWSGVDCRFKYFSNKTRLGMTKNWNCALSRSSGKYIIKLDADDKFKETIIENLVHSLNNNNKAAFASCLANDCSESLACTNGIYGHRGFELAGLDPFKDQLLVPEKIFPYLFADVQLWHSCALMFRRGVLMDLNGWDENLGCASDTDIILRAFVADYSLYHVGCVGLDYRRRTNSVSYKFRKNNQLLWEGVLIHLQAVIQWHNNGKKIDKPLKIGWYRFWLRYKILSGQVGAADLCVRYKEHVERIVEPPLALRIIENCRMILHGWKRKMVLLFARRE